MRHITLHRKNSTVIEKDHALCELLTFSPTDLTQRCQSLQQKNYAPFSYFLIDFFSFFDFKFDKNGKIHSTYEL